MNYKCKGIAVLLLLGCASSVYCYVKSRNLKKRITHRTRRKHIHDVLIFSEVTQSALVRSKFSKSLVHPSTDRLFSYLSLAHHNLDICMYMITSPDIAHLIIKLHNKGVLVRLIVDADMAYATGSATKRIERRGIEMRWMKSTNLMHHKFCLIDTSATSANDDLPFAMIGSLNWTNQAVTGNWENVLVTTNNEIINGLKEEFEKLWLKFKPIDKISSLG